PNPRLVIFSRDERPPRLAPLSERGKGFCCAPNLSGHKKSMPGFYTQCQKGSNSRRAHFYAGNRCDCARQQGANSPPLAAVSPLHALGAPRRMKMGTTAPHGVMMLWRDPRFNRRDDGVSRFALAVRTERPI